MQRLEEIARNRPVGVQCGPCTTYPCKQTTADALAALAAGDVEAAPARAWVRAGHAAVQCGHLLLVFGGMAMRCCGTKCADLLCLDTERMEWRLQATRGERPTPRSHHAMAADPEGRRVFVFGGRKASGRRSCELFVLDLLTWTWHAPKTDGELPGPRERCAITYASGRLAVFGGRAHGTRLNDLWTLNTETWAWEQQPATGAAPSPRQDAAACLEPSGQQLWVHGGLSNHTLADVFVYSMEAQARGEQGGGGAHRSSAGCMHAFGSPTLQPPPAPPLPPGRSGARWRWRGGCSSRAAGGMWRRTQEATSACLAGLTRWAPARARCTACAAPAPHATSGLRLSWRWVPAPLGWRRWQQGACWWRSAGTRCTARCQRALTWSRGWQHGMW